jgi:GTPase
MYVELRWITKLLANVEFAAISELMWPARVLRHPGCIDAAFVAMLHLCTIRQRTRGAFATGRKDTALRNRRGQAEMTRMEE